MKKLMFICLAAISILLAGCKKDDPESSFSANVVTYEATNISWTSFTLNGAVTCKGDCTPHTITMGIFYSDKAGVSDTQKIGETEQKSVTNDATVSYSRTVGNASEEDGVFTYKIQPGGTCYYVCYAKIDGKYTYGKEVSFTVPSRK